MSQQKSNTKVNDASTDKVQNVTITDHTSVKSKADSDVETDNVEESTFLERWENSRFWLIKGTYYILHTVWVIVMTIGTIIVWLISLLFV